MLKSFLKYFTGETVNPTSSWLPQNLGTPILRLREGAVGELRFGSLFDQAQVFGRPESFRRHSEQYCELLYSAAGFQIDYEQGKLAYVAYFIGPDTHLPAEQVVFCTPKLSSGLLLTRSTSEQELTASLGKPASVDRDSDETVLCYKCGMLTLEFELSGAGELKRLNAYPTKTA